jgi:iron complex transport system substrate-binding protein
VRFHRALYALFALVAALSLACTSNTNNPHANAPAGAATSPATRAAASAAATASPATAAATTGPATPAAAAYPLSIKRSDGKELVLKAQPKRIVSLSSGTTEIFYAIGSDSQLVATDKYSDYPEAAKSTTKLDAFRPSAEAIAALNPDLVVVVDNQKQIVETLDGLNIPTLYLTVPGSLKELLQQIQLYGNITGHPAEAQKLATAMQARIDAVQQKVAGAGQGPRIYHEVDPKLFTAAPNSFIGDLYTTLRAQNIVPTGDKQYPQITQEFIVSKNPEVIIVGDTLTGETADSVKSRPGWAAISAVANNRVYPIDDSLVSRPGPRIVDALETLAKLLYPDRF